MFCMLHPTMNNTSLKGMSRLEPLEYFLKASNSNKFALFRLKNYARQKLNLSAFLNKEFDGEFDYKSNDRLYCTELVIKAFSQTYPKFEPNIYEQNFSLLNMEYNIITPSNFLNLNSQEIIKIKEVSTEDQSR